MHGMAELEMPRITSRSSADGGELRMMAAVVIKVGHGIVDGKGTRGRLAMRAELFVAPGTGFVLGPDQRGFGAAVVAVAGGASGSVSLELGDVMRRPGMATLTLCAACSRSQ